MKDKLKEEMLEAIFVQTGGRLENPKIADVCAEIAVNFIANNTPVIKSLPELNKCTCWKCMGLDKDPYADGENEGNVL